MGENANSNKRGATDGHGSHTDSDTIVSFQTQTPIIQPRKMLLFSTAVHDYRVPYRSDRVMTTPMATVKMPRTKNTLDHNALLTWDRATRSADPMRPSPAKTRV